MNREEIDYWLKFFYNKPICYKSGEDKEISFAKVFMEFKELQQENKKQKEIIDMFLNKINRNKMLLNNPDILDVYLKIKDLPD